MIKLEIKGYLDIINSFAYYTPENLLSLGDADDMQIFKLLHENKYIQASQILNEKIATINPNKAKFILYKFLNNFCLMRCPETTHEDLHQISNQLEELHHQLKFNYPAILWEKANILLKLGELLSAKKYYELIIGNHEQARLWGNKIIQTKAQYEILYPIFEKHNIFIRKYKDYFKERAKNILYNHSEFGVAEAEIPKIQEKAIQQKLEIKWHEYANQQLPKPQYQGLFRQFALKKPLNIAYFNIKNSLDFYQEPTLYHFSQSMRQRGHVFHEILIENTDTSIPTHIFIQNYDFSAIYNSLKINNIDCIFMNYNNIIANHESENFFNFIAQVNNNLKIPVIRYLQDYYNASTPIPEKWFNAISLFVSLNKTISDPACLKNHEKFLHFPIAQTTDNNECTTKTRNFCFIGDAQSMAMRQYFLQDIHQFIPNIPKIKVNSDNKVETMDEFISIYRQSKITFNSGHRFLFRNNDLYISTFRISEAIVNKCLLLEEGTMSCEDIYVPFVHYIPVYNRNDVMIYAQFFLKHEEWREKIVNEAYNFWQENYSYNHIWSEIERRLGFL